ncbi:MAG: hypothetical protein AB7N76_05195 [Planctomycetota bacterium]
MKFPRSANTPAAMQALIDPSSPTEFTLAAYGTFERVEIQSIVDNRDGHWFDVPTVAKVLGLDSHHLRLMVARQPGEVVHLEDWREIEIGGRTRRCYSEQAFLKIVNMVNLKGEAGERAYRLREWIRKKLDLRVRQENGGIVVEAKGQALDLSDASAGLQIAYQLVKVAAEHERQIKETKAEVAEVKAEVAEVKAEVAEVSKLGALLSKWEDGAKIKPGEMTAECMAAACGWYSTTGNTHHSAVIHAAADAGFESRGLLVRRYGETTTGVHGAVERFIFTVEGVEAFRKEVDAAYAKGRTHVIPRSPGHNRNHTFVKQ